MSDDFRSAVEAMDDQPGDTSAQSVTSETTAVDQLAAEPIQGTTETHDAPVDTAAPATDPDDLRSYLEQQKREHPDQSDVIDRIYRDMQGAWTPKLQEAAELKRQMEAYAGLDPEIAPFMRHVNEVALVDPQAAAALWDQAKQQLFGNYQQQTVQAQSPEVPEGWEYWTDNERYLYTRQQELETRLQQNDAWRQQEVAAQGVRAMQQQWDQIKTEFGQDIPDNQREAAANWCLQRGLKADSIGLAWKALYGVQLARQLGRNEAAGLVERKSAMTPGPSAIATPPAGPEAEPTTLRGAIAAGYGIRE